MKQFMDKDFLLSTDMAKTLYHDFAENMPILDYHCHINPQEIYEDASLTPSPRCGWERPLQMAPDAFQRRG